MRPEVSEQVNFSIWYERYGAGLPEEVARTVWSAAVDAAYERLTERATLWRMKVQVSSQDVDTDHAAAKMLESRACAHDVYAMKE